MKYPVARLGKWRYESTNYIIPTAGSKPVPYILNVDFDVISQQGAFVFIDNKNNPVSETDTIGVWKKNGKCWDIYVVQDRSRDGYQVMSPVKRDKCGRIVEMNGVYIESGFTPNTPQRPTVGNIKAYWVSDF